MEKLYYKEAKDLASKYEFLIEEKIPNYPIKAIIQYPHKEDENYYTVIVVIATDIVGKYDQMELKDFCRKFGYHFP